MRKGLKQERWMQKTSTAKNNDLSVNNASKLRADEEEETKRTAEAIAKIDTMTEGEPYSGNEFWNGEWDQEQVRLDMTTKERTQLLVNSNSSFSAFDKKQKELWYSEMAKRIEPKTYYQHYKGDNCYVVISVGRMESTLEEVVVYQKVNWETKKRCEGLIWVRSVKEFCELTESGVTRFKQI